MKTLTVFGPSILYGSELADVSKDPSVHSNITFTALAAKKLNYNYNCFAKTGASNAAITRRITNYANNISPGVVFVLWTYESRFEFKFNYPVTYGSNLNPSNWLSVMPVSNNVPDHTLKFINDFYKHVGTNYDYGMFNTIQSILLAQTVLEKANIPYIFACGESDVLTTIKLKAHSNFNIHTLLKYIDTTKFLDQESGFLEWAQKGKYKIGPNGHPLEKAHEDYSEFIVDILQKLDKN